ncbi:MAG: S1C family serine protease [Endozoicomonas sp.]
MATMINNAIMKKFLTHIVLPLLTGLAVGLLIIVIKPDLIGLEKDHFTRLFDRSTDFLGSGQASYSTAVKKAAPAVVNISTATLASLPEYNLTPRSSADGNNRSSRGETSLGSGVIVGQDGYLLTNNHVIDNADSIIVTLRDNRKAPAAIVGRDPETDLAVLKVDLREMPSIKLADSSLAEVGDVVLAIGNPFDLGQTVTMGIISATGRNDLRLNTYEDFIQTDAAINIGNSGGALVNAYGDLIGINTLLFSRGGGNEGIGFAIPSSMARFVMNSIIKYGRVIRGWLGIESQPLTPELADAFGVNSDIGILISGVYKGGPADLAGLQRGDILTGINGVDTSDGKKVMNMVAQVPPGSEVTIQILRDDKPMDVKAKVTTRPNMVN